MVEDIKKDFNNSLKEIQENTAKALQVLIEKQENTSKQVMEMNKTILDLKREVVKIKKTQRQPATFLVSAQGSTRPERFVPQAPAGAPLAVGLSGGQAARVKVWNTEASHF